MAQKRAHVFLPEGLLADIDQFIGKESAALRGLFNWLVIKQVVPDNPALFVKGPKFSRQVGITPILEPEQMRKLLDPIPVTREVKIPRKHGGGVRVEADVKGLRDRAIIAIMAYIFARVSAVLKLKRGDYSLQGKRARLRLLEKGNKEKLVWLHHEAGAVSRCLSRRGADQRGRRADVSDAESEPRSRGSDFPARHAARRQGTLHEGVRLIHDSSRRIIKSLAVSSNEVC